VDLSPRRSRALPITLTILLAAGWFATWETQAYWASRSAGSSRSYYSPAVQLARVELQLRAVGLRRCAARTGRLPRTLAQCAADMPRLSQLLDFHDKKPEGMSHFYLRAVINEPWRPSEDPTRPKGARLAPAPPPSLDYLGLPIHYRPGAAKPDGTWLGSQDLLADPVTQFLVHEGGVPPPSKQPFLLSSVFLQHREAEQREKDRKASNIRAMEFGGLLGLVLAGVLISVLWCGRRIRAVGIVSISLGSVLAFLVTAGSCMFYATCYAMAHFRSSSMRRSDRMAILEQGVKRGEIPKEVARTARRYIEALPEPKER